MGSVVVIGHAAVEFTNYGGGAKTTIGRLIIFLILLKIG